MHCTVIYTGCRQGCRVSIEVKNLTQVDIHLYIFCDSENFDITNAECAVCNAILGQGSWVIRVRG